MSDLPTSPQVSASNQLTLLTPDPTETLEFVDVSPRSISPHSLTSDLDALTVGIEDLELIIDENKLKLQYMRVQQRRALREVRRKNT